MRRVLLVAAVFAIGSIWIGSGAAGAAKATVTGCTAVTPTELQGIFGVPYAAGVSAGAAFLPTDCRFNTSTSQPPATGQYGSVIVSVATGKPGDKLYANALASAPKATRTAVPGVGRAAFTIMILDEVATCPGSGGYRIAAKNAKGTTMIWSKLNVSLPACRPGVTTAQMGQVATVVLSKL